MMDNLYEGKTDHDLMVRMATQMDEIVVPEIKLLRAEDNVIHDRITGEGKATAAKIERVNERIGRIKIWATVSAAIGGAIGSVVAFFTTKGG